ncbi:MAG: glycosyltransferase family 4 protein, partial [Gemmatimonas sp.]
LLISQVYVPDPASVGQHMAGAARELVQRGHRVVVLTSARGYDDPAERYPLHEVRDGVEVRRIRFSSFGKGSLLARALGGMSFVLQATVRALFLKNLDGVVVTTAPPFAGLALVVMRWFRNVPYHYWVMDLSPDVAVATGHAKAGSPFVRAFNWLNRRILASASSVVVLDRFMQQRVVAKLPAVQSRLRVLPPWPLDDVRPSLPHASNTFRAQHGLQGKFVVMYSGNHSPANPLRTLLDAAAGLEHLEHLVFLFVGGGAARHEVDRCGLRNVRSLPYQPLAALHESLSAADVHVVSLGNAVVGMVHPCKVYGAMAVARPILLFGPAQNHVTDLLQREVIGWHCAHDDVAGTIATIGEMLRTPPEELHAMGSRAQHVIAGSLDRATLTGALCDVFEQGEVQHA